MIENNIKPINNKTYTKLKKAEFEKRQTKARYNEAQHDEFTKSCNETNCDKNAKKQKKKKIAFISLAAAIAAACGFFALAKSGKLGCKLENCANKNVEKFKDLFEMAVDWLGLIIY